MKRSQTSRVWANICLPETIRLGEHSRLSQEFFLLLLAACALGLLPWHPCGMGVNLNSTETGWNYLADPEMLKDLLLRSISRDEKDTLDQSGRFPHALDHTSWEWNFFLTATHTRIPFSSIFSYWRYAEGVRTPAVVLWVMNISSSPPEMFYTSFCSIF